MWVDNVCLVPGTLFLYRAILSVSRCHKISNSGTSRPEHASLEVMPYSSIQELFGSNLGQETAYLDWGFSWFYKYPRSWDSIVGLVTGYELDVWEAGDWVPEGSRNFLFSTSSRPSLRSTQPPIQPMGTGALSPGVKRQGCEADHSPPASAEVKKMWIYTSTLPYGFMM
jgi:hypothetical protein